ncbi:Uncharacterised protein [uncultured archaeon]|nr:Uncharacterised protein [uncultured archaeon]
MSARKGQVATEFFIYSGVFLAVMLAAYFTIFFIQTAEISNKESLYVRWFGESFASHANTAMSGDAGFNYTMRFDKNILGKPYVVQFQPANAGSRNAFLYITWTSNNVTFPYAIGNMTLRKGSCVQEFSPASGRYYEINSILGMLNFYNDGENLTLSQVGCT